MIVKPFAAAKDAIDRSLATKVKESFPENPAAGIYFRVEDPKILGKSD